MATSSVWCSNSHNHDRRKIANSYNRRVESTNRTEEYWTNPISQYPDVEIWRVSATVGSGYEGGVAGSCRSVQSSRKVVDRYFRSWRWEKTPVADCKSVWKEGIYTYSINSSRSQDLLDRSYKRFRLQSMVSYKIGLQPNLQGKGWIQQIKGVAMGWRRKEARWRALFIVDSLAWWWRYFTHFFTILQVAAWSRPVARASIERAARALGVSPTDIAIFGVTEGLRAFFEQTQADAPEVVLTTARAASEDFLYTFAEGHGKTYKKSMTGGEWFI